MNALQDEEELAHFQRIVAAFKNYRANALQRITKTERFIESLPCCHQDMLAVYRRQLKEFRQCVDKNSAVLLLIIKDVENIYENVKRPVPPMNGDGVSCSYEDNTFYNMHLQNKQPATHDAEKVQSVLKNLVRDWGAAGAAEREQCYMPIIEEIITRFPPNTCDPEKIKVLVPGAGLGRMAWEIAARGYCCQGNEVSLFMVFASNFILNHCPEVNKLTIYPYIHQFVNNLSSEHQMQEVRVPDVPPPSLHNSNFSMACGDFLKVYTESEAWDCVATCFFIDCAPNVIDFVETIYKILKVGGYWINLGPLLYHYSDMPSEDSIEPPYDVLKTIIENTGFEIQVEKTGVKTKYAQNPNSMLQYEYDSVFFVCKK